MNIQLPSGKSVEAADVADALGLPSPDWWKRTITSSRLLRSIECLQRTDNTNTHEFNPV